MKAMISLFRTAIWLIVLYCWVSRGNEVAGQQQQVTIDSLKRVLEQHPEEDTARVDLLATLSMATKSIDPFQALVQLDEALRIAKKLKNQRKQIGIEFMLGFLYNEIGDSPKSIAAYQQALELTPRESLEYSTGLGLIGMVYESQGDLEKALDYAKQCWRLQEESKDSFAVVTNNYNFGNLYYKKKQPDSALHFARIAYDRLMDYPEGNTSFFYPMITSVLGNIYIALDQKDSAKKYIDAALLVAYVTHVIMNEIESTMALAVWFNKYGPFDSAITYAKKTYLKAKSTSNFDWMQQSALLARSIYQRANKYDLALEFNDLAIAAKDSLQGIDKVKKTQAMHYDFRLKEQQLEDLKRSLSLKSRLRLLTVFSIFFIAFILFLYRTIHQRKKTIRTLNAQNNLIEEQKKELHGYIDELKDKQMQLIHAEKMASLGELTAGVAHEIQNPLNFVNNFSELTAELMDEMEKEFSQGDPMEAMVIAGDIKQNLGKISHHGKRAESIVRSMLEHSQVRPGERIDTDFNTLAEEYLKLAYHAARAKDNSFNVNIVTHLDPSVPLIKIIPADVGRVLINIFNNAFYSMEEKKKKGNGDFHPTLMVRTALSTIGDTAREVVVQIRDNGMGIRQAILAKIFQPFYTTKPTGSGTGLGLYLSYDIIHNVHGGNISVDSVEGDSCEFTITFPLK